MTSGASFALVSLGDSCSETVVMLVDDETEAQEIAAGMRRAGQQVDVRRYVPRDELARRP